MKSTEAVQFVDIDSLNAFMDKMEQEMRDKGIPTEMPIPDSITVVDDNGVEHTLKAKK